MAESMPSILQRLRTSPPRCIKNLKAVPVSRAVIVEELVTTTWELGCHCGATRGSILGYFDTGNPYAKISITPIAYECPAQHVTELLDTDVHGYHAEVAKLEGTDGLDFSTVKGQGQRAPYLCAQCGQMWFRLTIAFCYWQGAFDLFLDEPQLPMEDFFNEAELSGICQECGASITLTDISKF